MKRYICILIFVSNFLYAYDIENLPQKVGVYYQNKTVLFVVEPKENSSIEFHIAFKNELLKDTVYTKNDIEFFNQNLTNQVFINAKGLFNHHFKYKIDSKVLINEEDRYIVEVQKNDIEKYKVDKKHFSKDELKDAFNFIIKNNNIQFYLKKWKVYEEWLLNKPRDEKLPKEYQKLLSDFYNNNSDFTKVGNYILLEIIFNSFGHFNINKKLSSKQDSDYTEAKKLFDDGKDLDKIIILLAKSLNNNPNHKQTYKYLAISLKAKKMYYEALAILNQLLRLDKDDFVIKAHIVDCYYELGYKDLSKNYAKYIEILNTNNNEFINKVLIKIAGINE
ncbi:tetratricopeptide repeat protein [Sulfurimonas sp.]